MESKYFAKSLNRLVRLHGCQNWNSTIEKQNTEVTERILAHFVTETEFQTLKQTVVSDNPTKYLQKDYGITKLECPIGEQDSEQEQKNFDTK